MGKINSYYFKLIFGINTLHIITSPYIFCSWEDQLFPAQISRQNQDKLIIDEFSRQNEEESPRPTLRNDIYDSWCDPDEIVQNLLQDMGITVNIKVFNT